MTVRAAIVTLKQHRFEVATATVAALAVTAWTVLTLVQLHAVSVPAACFGLLRADGEVASGDCASPLHAWLAILNGAEDLLQGSGVVPVSVMGILPFAVGLLGGVPIVSRELEARTAQTAWSLDGSRARWLGRQILPIGIVLGIAMASTAIATNALQEQRAIGGYPAYLDLGLHGALAMLRAFGAFGIGLLAGALLGRSLPAFIFGSALSFAILFGAGQVRDRWLEAMPATVVVEASSAPGEFELIPGSITTGWGWWGPDHRLLTWAEARAIATAAGVPPATTGDEEDGAATSWLQEHGYQAVQVGVTEEMALGWAPFDAGIYALTGVLGLLGTIVLIRRRRPT
jgi:hypothetical protein